jgi:hypothetical protein
MSDSNHPECTCTQSEQTCWSSGGFVSTWHNELCTDPSSTQVQLSLTAIMCTQTNCGPPDE